MIIESRHWEAKFNIRQRVTLVMQTFTSGLPSAELELSRFSASLQAHRGLSISLFLSIDFPETLQIERIRFSFCFSSQLSRLCQRLLSYNKTMIIVSSG